MTTRNARAKKAIVAPIFPVIAIIIKAAEIITILEMDIWTSKGLFLIKSLNLYPCLIFTLIIRLFSYVQ